MGLEVRQAEKNGQIYCRSLGQLTDGLIEGVLDFKLLVKVID